MTQTARPQTPWLVPPGDMTSFGRSSFTLACRGHEKMGEVLSYFVYEASWQAKNEEIDSQSEDCTFITIEREQKHMLGRIKTCQKSLIAYINQLEAWGFLVADGYRHTYQVHFRKITEAIHNPPETMKKKPRGKYAPTPSPEIQSETRLSQLQSQRAKLQSRLVKLQSEMVKIQSRMVTLQNQMVKIQSSQNAESTPEQDLEGEMELSRILRSTMNLLEDSLVISASAESDGGISFLSSLSQFEETLQEVQKGQAPLDVSNIPPGREQEEPGKSADTSVKPASASAVHDTTPTQNTLLEPPTEEQSTPTSETHEQDELKIRRKMKDCSPEIQARRRKWQDHVNKRRGGELLPTKGERIGESNAIASLVDRFTDSQLEAIDTFVLAEIFPYKLPTSKHKLGGCALLRESQNAREVLKDRRVWPIRDAPPGTRTTSTAPVQQEDIYTAFIRKKAAESAAMARQGVAL
jgi:hypothetical protein